MSTKHLTVWPRLLQNSRDSSGAKTGHILTPVPEFSFPNLHDSSDSLLGAKEYQAPIARTFELDLQSDPDGAKSCKEGFASTGWDTVTLPWLWTLSLLIYIQSQRDGQKYPHPAWNIRTHHSAQGFHKTMGLILASVTHKQPQASSEKSHNDLSGQIKDSGTDAKERAGLRNSIMFMDKFLKIVILY